MYEPPDIPFPEQRRWAVTRRVDMFLGWLNWNEYTTYTGQSASTKRLTDLVETINDVLGAGIPAEDWKPFHKVMVKIRTYIRLIAEQEGNTEKEQAIYNEGLLMIKTVLEEYKDYIQVYNFEVTG